MVTTAQRREKLESLLERLQRNRRRLKPGAVGDEEAALSVGAVAPSARPSASQPAPPTVTGAKGMIELSPEDLELESNDGGFELDLSGAEEDTDGVVIDLSMEDEVQETQSVTNRTLRDTSPSVGVPAQSSQSDIMASDSTIVEPAPLIDDDEPEIEVEYGTDEALALQEELGLGEAGIPSADIDSAEDQLTLLDLQMESSEPMLGSEIGMDNLPAQAAPAAHDTQVDGYPESSMSSPKSVPLLKPQAAREIPRAEALRANVRAETEEDLTGPLIELTFDDDVAEDEETDEYIDRSKDSMATPRRPVPPVRPRPNSADALAEALSGEFASGRTQAPVKHTTQHEVETRVVMTPYEEPKRDPVQYAPAPTQKDVNVAEIIGSVPTVRVKTFGELILGALSVGRKK